MIAYLETNFLLAAATGQDAQTSALLQTDRANAQLFMPDVCVMEGWYAIVGKRKEFAAFRAELDRRVREAQRDRTSTMAPSILPSLLDAQLRSGALLNDIERRFSDTLSAFVVRGELLPLLPIALDTSLKQRHIDAPADNLILHVICEHAARHHTTDRVLLTANTNDFASSHVRNVLRAYGVTSLVSDCSNLTRQINAII
ncbi:MAG TPA: hypothetical protein VLI90_01525 [Tepidisphaeraceae bacterium]|nr:hypothetical protein [Tepidisphaeraceae bacterium]